MLFQLVLSEPENETQNAIYRDTGENVFLNNLPSDYEVYLLYYPGTSLNSELEKKLRDLGNMTGKNLFVNIAKLDDPNYKKVQNKFNIRTFPTIIITAIDELASTPTEYSTAYVKIDNKKLLNSMDLTVECIDKMFNLFIEGKISQAMREEKSTERIFLIKDLINNALRGMGGYLKDWEISFSFIIGKLELKSIGKG